MINQIDKSIKYIKDAQHDYASRSFDHDLAYFKYIGSDHLLVSDKNN